MPIQVIEPKTPGLRQGQPQGPGAAISAAQAVGRAGQTRAAPPLPSPGGLNLGTTGAAGRGIAEAGAAVGQSMRDIARLELEETRRRQERAEARQIQAEARQMSIAFRVMGDIDRSYQEAFSSTLDMVNAMMRGELPGSPEQIETGFKKLYEITEAGSNITYKDALDQEELLKHLPGDEVDLLLNRHIGTEYAWKTLANVIDIVGPHMTSEAYKKIGGERLLRMIAQVSQATDLMLIGPYKTTMGQNGYVGEFEGEQGLADRKDLVGLNYPVADGAAIGIVDEITQGPRRSADAAQAGATERFLGDAAGYSSHIFNLYRDFKWHSGENVPQLENPGTARAMADTILTYMRIWDDQRSRLVGEHIDPKRGQQAAQTINQVRADLADFRRELWKQAQSPYFMDIGLGLKEVSQYLLACGITGKKYAEIMGGLEKQEAGRLREYYGITQEDIETQSVEDILEILGTHIKQSEHSRAADSATRAGVDYLSLYKPEWREKLAPPPPPPPEIMEPDILNGTMAEPAGAGYNIGR